MAALNLYENVVILDTQRHRNLRFTPFDDIGFARPTQHALLAAGEWFDCAVEYPIIFASSPEGPVAIALFGLRPGENLFVTDTGKWDGAYIPAFLRRYPFLPATSPDGSMRVAFDDRCKNLGEQGSELLIDGDGETQPFLKEIIAFLEQSHVGYAQSAAFAKSLADLGLLHEMNAEITPRGGETLRITGFMVVDEQKLIALPETELGALAKKGHLAMIYAHLISLRNLPKLNQRLQSKQTQATA